MILEGDEEKSVETVLCDTKWINLDGRMIKTRVLEKRAYELKRDKDTDEVVEETLIEISFNWFAICKQTSAFCYFGEDSRDCEDRGGFMPGSKTLCDDDDDGDHGGHHWRKWSLLWSH